MISSNPTAPLPADISRRPEKTAAWFTTTAPAALRKAQKSGDTETMWRAWQVHLAARKKPAIGQSRDRWAALQWCLTPEQARLLADIDASFEHSKRAVTVESIQRLVTELHHAIEREPVAGALAALLVAGRLPASAKHAPSETWWLLLDELCEIIHRAEQRHENVSSLAGQVLRGELPLTLAYLFPELKVCQSLLESGRDHLNIGIEEMFDGEGTLQAREWPALPGLLACWTRCRAIGAQLPGNCWNSTAEKQYRLFVRECFRWQRPDGRLPLGAAEHDVRDVLATALKLTPTAAWAAQQVRSRRDIKSPKVDKSRRPAVTSEWAQMAHLRRSWSGAAERLTVLYPDKKFLCEASAGGDLLWSGEWTADLRINGELQQPDGDWEEVCWFTDHEIDFLELELALTGDWKIQRQLVLGRLDPILFLADVIIGPSAAHIEYTTALPLSSAVKPKLQPENTEVVLAGRERKALVLPLGLSEWRSDSRAGKLSVEGRQLQLAQSAHGRGLYVPWFVDLSAKRAGKSYTWRQLTIGEHREIQSPDVAVGYRAQVGADNWLLYRSFRPGNRTILGHNLTSEFLLGRFTTEGEVEPLMEIE